MGSDRVSILRTVRGGQSMANKQDSFDALLRELADARSEYEQATDPAAKLAARIRLDNARSLVQESKTAGLSGVAAPDLQRQTEAVRRELARIDAQMWSPARSAFNSGLACGFDREDVGRLNQRIAMGTGREGVVRKLEALEAEFERRETRRFE